jgi:antitoxin MazE
MKARVQKWGNSLAVRIPKSFAGEASIRHDSLVEMSVEDGKIILLPVVEPKLSLAQLLEGVTEENRHQEVDTGSAVGGEAW